MNDKKVIEEKGHQELGVLEIFWEYSRKKYRKSWRTIWLNGKGDDKVKKVGNEGMLSRINAKRWNPKVWDENRSNGEKLKEWWSKDVEEDLDKINLMGDGGQRWMIQKQ